MHTPSTLRTTPRQQKLARPILCSLFILMWSQLGCGRSDLTWQEEAPSGPRWSLDDTFPPGPEPLPTRDSPLVGEWLGPAIVGGCIDEGTWQVYRPDGDFVQVDYNTNLCIPDEERHITPCQGAWMPTRLDPIHEKSGEVLYACRVEDPHPSQPEERYVETTFALLDRGQGWQEMSTLAWSWQEDGQMVRTQSRELTYPASPSFPTPERATTQSQTRLTLHQGSERGPRIRRVEDFDEAIFRGETRRYTLVIEMEARGTFSTFGLSEQGEEREVLEVEVRKVDDFLFMEADLPGESDFQAWSTYLQDKGINARYTVLGGVFSLAFSRTLHLDLRAPVAWAAPGAWQRVEEICTWYREELAEACQTL